MLATNTIDFYTKIKEELLKIQDTIKFIEQNNPINEKQEIMIEFLKSEVLSNTTYHMYNIKKNNTSDSEKLKNNYMSKYKKLKKEFDFQLFLMQTTVIKTNLEKIFQEYNFIEKNILSLVDKFYQLSSLYQNVFQNNDAKEDIVIFFNFAQECTSEYRLSLKNIDLFINSLSSNNEIIEKEELKLLELQLLDVEYNVGEFADILKHIDSAYSKISRLSKNIKITNLKVVKVESGSLLSKVLGDKNIIEVMSIALERILDFIYHNWTKEGKIELNSKIMQNISSDADIIKKLEEMGIDTKEAKEDISATLNAATKDLFETVHKAPKIKIDNKTIIITEPKTLLEHNRKYLNNTTTKEKDKQD